MAWEHVITATKVKTKAKVQSVLIEESQSLIHFSCFCIDSFFSLTHSVLTLAFFFFYFYACLCTQLMYF